MEETVTARALGLIARYEAASLRAHAAMEGEATLRQRMTTAQLAAARGAVEADTILTPTDPRVTAMALAKQEHAEAMRQARAATVALIAARSELLQSVPVLRGVITA